MLKYIRNKSFFERFSATNRSIAKPTRLWKDNILIKPLFRHKSAITRRRLIITFILCTIITVSIMTGYSKGLNSDGTIYTADGERIVMWSELPEKGTPEDFDAVTSFKYVAQRLYTSPYFRGDTVGDVVADLGLMKYKQHVHNTRVVKNGNVFAEAISSSSAKSVAEQKYIEGDIIIYRPSVKVNGDNVTWSDGAVRLDKEDFFTQYGVIPVELAKHAINEQTILSVRDNNAAMQKSAANAPAGDASGEVDDGTAGDVTYEVPQSLVKGDDGYYSLTFELDPYESTKYSRNEMRTLAGADNNPVVNSVTFTLVFDERFVPVSVSTAENYDIEIPFLGAMNCSSNLTETFYDIDGVGEIPYLDFFKAHMTGESGGEIPDAPKSPADYLASAFGAYMDGTKTLDLTADVAIGDVTINGLKISVDIAEMNVKAKLGDLYIEYAGDRVYLTKGDVKGYITTDKLKTLLENETVKGLLSSSSIPEIDLDGLLGGDILGKLFENCEMTTENGVTCIRLPFELADGIAIDASLFVKDEGMELERISGTVDAFGLNVSIDASPATVSFPAVGDGYSDFDPIVDFISDALDTALGGTTYGISGDVTINGTTLGIDAYIDRTDGEVTADGTVSAFGLSVGFEYIDNTVYLEAGNIKLAAEISDLPALIDAIGKIVDLDTIDFELIKSLLPKTIPEMIDVLDSMTVTNDKLSVGLKLIGIPVDLELTRGDGLLTGLKADVAIDMFDIKLDLAADLAITRPERHTVAPSGEYANVKNIISVIDAIEPYLDAQSIGLGVVGTVTTAQGDITLDAIGNLNIGDELDVAVSGSVGAFGQSLDLAYVDGTAYASVGTVKVKLDTATVAEMLPAIKSILGSFGVAIPDLDAGISLDFSQLSGIVDAVTSFDVTPNGKITAGLALGGMTASAEIDAAAGTVKLNGKAAGVTFDVTVTIDTAGKTVEAPTGADAYSDLAELKPTLDAAARIIAERSLATGFLVTVGDTSIGGNIAVAFDNGLAARVTLADYPVDVTIFENTVYVAVGNIKLAGSTDDVPAIMNALGDLIPDNVAATVNKLLGMLNGGSSLFPTELDMTSVLDSALDALTLFEIGNCEITAEATVDETTIGLTAKTDLSELTVATALGDTALVAKLYGIRAGAIVPAPDKAQYSSVSSFMPLIAPIVPLFDKEGYALRLDAELYGIPLSGDIYISLPDETHESVAVKLVATVSDVLAELTYINDRLYIAVGDVKLACGTTQADIEALVSALSPVVPQINDIIEMLRGLAETELDVNKLISAVTELSANADGATLSVDLGAFGTALAATIEVDYAENVPVAATVDARFDDKAIALSLGIAVKNGELEAMTCDEYGVSARITDTAKQTVTAPTGDFVEVAELTQYIAPIFELIEQAKTAQTIRMNISAYALTSDNKQMKINGRVAIALSPALAVDVTLDLFAGTDAQEPVYIRYTENVLYLKAGDIKLSFDTNNDIARVMAVVAQYLPDYLVDALNVMLGLEEGESELGTLDIIVNKITEATKKQSVEDKLSVLFAPVDNGKSAVALLVDMVGLSPANGVTASAEIMGVTLYASPDLTDGELSATISTNVLGMKIEATIFDLAFSDIAAAIKTPDDSGEYVSIAEFVETISYAIGTFTARDEEGNITFEITELAFTYAEKAKTDASGNTVDGMTVSVSNIQGKSALKGKIVPKKTTETTDPETGETTTVTTPSSFELEAHIVLSVSTLVDYGDISLSLYIKDNTAYVDYLEGKTGYGERVSIDYDSVMQIVAAALDILGVRGEAVDELIGPYRQPIDASIFESMNIVGLDKLQTMLNDLVVVVQNVRSALDKINEAWSIVETAGSAENLRARLDEIGALLKDAFAPFGKGENDKADEPTRTEYEQIDGSLFGKIVNGVKLKKSGNYLWAEVDNDITTGGTGIATVAVTQSGGVINGIDISDLDVRTADVKGGVKFVSGGEVTVTVPESATQSEGNTTYSDLANIKHLLFDVMNTANLMEFEIGDKTSSATDKINVNITIVGLDLININIAYSVKVKIIPQSDGSFKTAAIVDFTFKNVALSAVPDCSTRLTFYDDMFYVEGIAWRQRRIKELGTWRYYTTYEPVQVEYSLNDFTDMISNDMNKFLYDFLFYLMPLKIDLLSVSVPFRPGQASIGTNLQKKIADSIVGDGSSTTVATPTLATVFKGYEYADGKHSATIGLEELTGNGTLGDVTVDITGKNDADTNLLDNYIGGLSVNANLVKVTGCTVALNLNATLRNVVEYKDENEVKRIKSGGLTPTVIGDKSYDVDGFTAQYIPSIAWSAGGALGLPDWLAWA